MANEKTKEIMKRLEDGVDSVFTSEKYADYLKAMATFHSYSFGNIMLIYLQRPTASLVGGYTTWKRNGRQVKKGEHGITIIAPCLYKKKHDDTNDDAEEVTATYFKTATVFDVSQTEGKELPELCHELTASVENFETLRNAIEKAAGIPVSYEHIEKKGCMGYFNPLENEIVVSSEVSELQTLKTLIHETAHSVLHCKGGREENADRETQEVEAESIAYVVASALGIDTSDYSFGYIAGWSSGKEHKELTASLKIIRETADELLKKISSKSC